jgi:gliding motility-associated-like protein
MTTKITFLRSIILLITLCASSSLFALTFSTTKTDIISCHGDKTGSIVVSVADAVGNCYYSLTEDFALQQTSNKFENLAAGTYTVYVKDDNGIVGPDNITIYEPEALEIAEISNTISICNNGTIAIKVQGGTAPYTYSLDGFTTEQTSNTFTSLSIGAYTAYVKDANGCEAQTAANSISINTLSVEPLKSKPAANVVCATDKNASVTFTVVGRTEVVAENDTARYYSVKLFDITNQHEVIAPDLKYSNKFHPVLFKNRTEKEPVLDENGEPTFNELGEPITKNVTYKDTLWTEGCHEPTKAEEVLLESKIEYTEDMKGFDCNDKITVSGLGAGAYKIRFFKGDCEFAEEITFTVGITGSLPTAQINNVESFCDGSEYTITPTIVSNPGVSKYEWILDDVVLAKTKELTHIFTIDNHNKALKLNVTNRCGSTTSNIVLTKVNKRPTATIQTNTDLCRNPQSEVSIRLTGKGPFTYTLADSTEKTTEDVFVKEAIDPDSDITFTLLSLKDQNCESIAEDINTVEVKQPDVLTVEPLKKTPAASVVCETDKTASVSFTVLGRTEIVAATDSATYYTVKLFNIDNQQEIVDEDFKFTNKFHSVITKNRVEKEPVLDENGEPTLDENGEIITKDVTYKDTLWTEGCHEATKIVELEKYNYNETMFGFDCNDKITVSGLGAGAYSIRFFKGECEFAEQITFTVDITGSIPSVYINEVGSFCNETETTIIPMVESNPSATKYEWTLDDILIGEEKELTRAFILDENNKTLKLTVTNKCGVVTSNSILVQVNPRPTALLETSKDYLCKNQPTEVSITLTGEGPFTYTLPDGTEKTVEDVYSQENIIPVRDTVFTLTTLKDANCEAQIEKDVNTVETKIYPEPEYDMTITVPEPMVSGRYVKVNATEGFVNYTLFINEEEIPAKGPENIFWAKKFPFGVSTNDFKMTFTDENGCEWTLEESQIIESKIFPNIFTPNGDGVNDVFLADYDLKVYDRQGTLMYEGTSGWDGTHNGVEANQGVYLYTLFIPTEDGNLEVIKSTLTLER